MQPSGYEGEVKSIEMHHQAIEEAVTGDNIGFTVRGLGRDQVKRGSVVGHINNKPTKVKEFIANIMVFNHPTSFGVGYTSVFHIHTAQVACTFVELRKKMNPRGEVVEEHPQYLKSGDAALVKLKPIQDLVAETFNDFPQLGRFVIRDSGKTIAAGRILEIVPKE